MAKITKPNTSKGLAQLCGKLAQEKLAGNILILDLTQTETAPADYFVICTSDSDVQAKAITDNILKKCKEFDFDKPKTEGLTGGYWILIDFFDVIVHIMLPEARNFYKLEKLWGDAKFSTLDDEGKVKPFNRKKLNYD